MKEEVFKNRFEELNARDVAMDKLETCLNFRNDESESRHAAMEEREEGMNELQQIRFNEHEKLMSSLKLKEEVFKNRFEELYISYVAMDELETGLKFRNGELESRHAAIEESE